MLNHSIKHAKYGNSPNPNNNYLNIFGIVIINRIPFYRDVQ